MIRYYPILLLYWSYYVQSPLRPKWDSLQFPEKLFLLWDCMILRIHTPRAFPDHVLWSSQVKCFPIWFLELHQHSSVMTTLRDWHGNGQGNGNVFGLGRIARSTSTETCYCHYIHRHAVCCTYMKLPPPPPPQKKKSIGGTINHVLLSVCACATKLNGLTL